MALTFFNGKIRFDRHEWAGSFGDIGTDFPLIVSMILTCGLDPGSVLIMFGVMQILTGSIYGIPMPVQPLKAMAVIMITQKLGANVLFGGGLAIGLTMFILSVTGLIVKIANLVPKCVIRGIQFGLGMQLSLLALKEYVPSGGAGGYVLAGVSFALIIALMGNKKCPPALLVILLGLVYAFLLKINARQLMDSIGFHLPHFATPRREDVLTGFVVLALPQLCLSLGNSVLATNQVIKDFFPKESIGVRKISLTYSLMNMVVPFFNGIPVCHGSGGMVGHYTFGARTGGSVVIYGMMYLMLGLFFSHGFEQVIELFPKPMLGIILLFEGWALMRLMQDMKENKKDFSIILLVGLMAVGLPYGYIIGLVGGTILVYLLIKKFIRLGEE